MEAKYKFYEVVRIGENAIDRKYIGRKGAVLGMAQNDNGQWFYSVHIYDADSVLEYSEEGLDFTGEMDKRESFYDGTSIKVAVNPKTGEGEIINGG